MAKLQSDLKEFIALLNSRKAEYIVVGGHAVAFHGYPRFTGDIDFFLRATPDNAERVLSVLKDFGFGDLQIGISDLTTPNRVIQLGRPPNRIDLLTSISGVEFDDAWPSRVSTDLDGEQYDPRDKQCPVYDGASRERSVGQSRVNGDAESAEYRGEHGGG